MDKNGQRPLPVTNEELLDRIRTHLTEVTRFAADAAKLKKEIDELTRVMKGPE